MLNVFTDNTRNCTGVVARDSALERFEEEAIAGMRVVSRNSGMSADVARNGGMDGYCQNQDEECSATEKCCEHLTCDTDLTSESKVKVCKDWCEFRYRNPDAEYNKIKSLIINKFPEKRAEICEVSCEYSTTRSRTHFIILFSPRETSARLRLIV